jgi:peptidoglycan DL-endopeptidase RipA
MTEIGVDAGAVGDAASRAKSALNEVLGEELAGTAVSDARVAEALERLRSATQEEKGVAEGHLDTGANAARTMESSDAAGATGTAGIGAAGATGAAGSGGAPRVQPNVQITPAALAQMAGATSPTMQASQMAAMTQAARPMNAMNLMAPMVAQAAQAATYAAAPSAGKVVLTPDQQRQLAEALSEGARSSSGSLNLGSSSGELSDIARALVSADIPYAWGGGSLDGPSQGISDGGGAADAHGDYNKVGFDCSGLSRYVHYQLTGEEVARTSEAQYSQGTEIPQSEAQPGDFVFPNSSFGPGGPGHVQIYLGDGKVLEAPQSGDQVKISEMTPSVVKRM